MPFDIEMGESNALDRASHVYWHDTVLGKPSRSRWRAFSKHMGVVSQGVNKCHAAEGNFHRGETGVVPAQPPRAT